MDIVIDTNILMSALIRDSSTRKIIIESGLDFFYPENSFKEIIKYKEYILEKSSYNEKEFLIIFNKLLEYISLVPLEIIQPKIKEAIEIFGKIDIKDVLFIATALSLNGIIWSEDSDFEKQNKVKIIKTKNLIDEFEK